MDAVITELSKHIGSKWKVLARHLLFSPTDIDVIEYDNLSNLREQIYQFFYKWKQQQGPDASVEQLIERLEAAQLQELLDCLEKAGLLPDTNTNISQSPNAHPTTFPGRRRGLRAPENPTDTLQGLGCKLLNTDQYKAFRYYYNRKDVQFLIRYSLVGLFIYQSVIALLLTLCEDGGFSPSNFGQNAYVEVMHRTLKFVLRMGTRVVTPLVFMTRLDTLAEVPAIPPSSLTQLEVLQRVRHVHERFTRRKELDRIRNCSDPQNVFEMSVDIVKLHITSSFQIVFLHAILFTALLFNLGAFSMAEEKMMKGGICDYYDSVLGECISVFIIVLLVGIVKEFYCYENRVATYAMLVGKEAKDIYRQIRRRWLIIDWYCYCMPIGLLIVGTLSCSTGKAFTPEPSKGIIEPTDVAGWFFWTFVLSALTYFATSTNRLTKHAVLICYIACIIFVRIIPKNGFLIHVPATGDCAIVLLFTALAVLNFNLIFTLYRCNKYHHKATRSSRSWYLMVYCVVCMFLLFVLVTVIASREISYFSDFLK